MPRIASSRRRTGPAAAALAAVLAVAGLLAGAAAHGATGVEIWDTQAIDGDGKGTHPALALDPVDPNAWVTFQGIVLNRPQDMLDPATQWQMYVQAVPTNVAPYNQGGIALYANAWYMAPVNDWPRYETHWQSGDLVEVTGLLMFYNGKTNLNERHDPDNVFTVTYLDHVGLPEPWLLANIAQAVVFDPARAAGGERYQAQWSRLEGAWVDSGTWAADEFLTITDASGATMGLQLGWAADWGILPPGKFNVTAIFDQEDASGTPWDAGYRLWPLSPDQIQLWGDVNGDGRVDDLDRAIVLGNQGLEDAAWDDGDFNGDGLVDDLDLGELDKNLGVVLPEPGTLALVAAGGLAAAFARRRAR